MTLARQLTGTSAAQQRVAGLATLRLAAAPGIAPLGPVLLLPGFTGSKEDFAPILDPLAAAGFDVTAVDLPGQFESPGPDDPRAYSPDALTGVTRELARAVGHGNSVHLVGHSYGGLVARATVLAEPTLVRSLVLMSSGPAAIGGQRRAMIDLLEPVLPAVGLAGLYEQMVSVSADMPGIEPPTAELAEFLRRRFVQSSPAMLRGMGLALRTEPDRTAQLAAAGCPTLVVYGEADDAWPPSVQRAMADRLGASVSLIAEARHSPAAENPAATVEALTSFWASLPPLSR